MFGHKSTRALERENEELRGHCRRLAESLRVLVDTLHNTAVAVTMPDGSVQYERLLDLPELREAEPPRDGVARTPANKETWNA